MPSPVRRLFDALRSAMLVLLVVGLIAKPVLTAIGEVHAAEHALVADSDIHGPQDHGDDDRDGDPGNDHTQGEHGLMHQCAGSAFAATTSIVAMTGALRPNVDLPPARPSLHGIQRPTTPFRPPISA